MGSETEHAGRMNSDGRRKHDRLDGGSMSGNCGDADAERDVESKHGCGLSTQNTATGWIAVVE